MHYSNKKERAQIVLPPSILAVRFAHISCVCVCVSVAEEEMKEVTEEEERIPLSRGRERMRQINPLFNILAQLLALPLISKKRVNLKLLFKKLFRIIDVWVMQQVPSLTLTHSLCVFFSIQLRTTTV